LDPEDINSVEYGGLLLKKIQYLKEVNKFERLGYFGLSDRTKEVKEVDFLIGAG